MKGDTRKRYEEFRIILVDILYALRGKSGGCKRYKRTLWGVYLFSLSFLFLLNPAIQSFTCDLRLYLAIGR